MISSRQDRLDRDCGCGADREPRATARRSPRERAPAAQARVAAEIGQRQTAEPGIDPDRAGDSDERELAADPDRRCDMGRLLGLDELA